MAIKKILYQDKVGIVPKTIQINQVWDDDMNEIKEVVNSNSDQLTTNTQDIANLKTNPVSANNVSAVPSLVYLIGTNVQAQLDQTEANLIGLYKLDKNDEKSLKQTGRNRVDKDVSVVTVIDGNTLSITAVNDILFVNEIITDSNTNKQADFVKSFGDILFVMDGTNTPLAVGARSVFYLGINKLGGQVFRTARVFDQDVCYLARVLVENNAGVYNIIGYKYMPDLAINKLNYRGRLVISSGYIVPSGSASISFGNRAFTFLKNSINYANDHNDPNYLQVPDNVGINPMQFLFILPNVSSTSVPLTFSTILNPTQWYNAAGAVGAGAVAANNYQVYNLLLSVTGNILIQTKASTSNAPAAGVNAIFGSREEALAGLTSVVFPPIPPDGDYIVVGTFYLRAGTAANGSQLNLTNDFYFQPKTSSVSISSTGVTTHDALSGKNDNPAFLHVTSTDITNWNGKANDNNVVHLSGAPETITSVKTFTTNPNAVVTNIDMPAINNSPAGSVPDALVIKIRGHNGSTVNYSAGISIIAHGNRSGGFAFTNSEADPDLTNGVAFYAKLKPSSVGNLFSEFYKGTELISSINDAGIAFFKGLIKSSSGMEIKNSSGNPFIDLTTTPGNYASLIFENTTNQFRIYNSGVLAFIVDNTGNVGIGLNNPLTKVEIAGGTNGGVLVRADDNAYTIPTNGLGINSAYGVGYITNYRAGNPEDLHFNARNFIFDIGNLGIGTTTNISSILTLKSILTNGVASEVVDFRIQDASGGNTSNTGFFIKQKIDSGTTGDFHIGVVDSGNHTYALAFDVNGAERMRIDRSGNVGVGTPNPLQKFVVSNNGALGFEVALDPSNNLITLQSYDRIAAAYRIIEYTGSLHLFRTGIASTGTTNNFTEIITPSDGGKGLYHGMDITNRLFYWRKNDSDDYGFDFQKNDGTSFFRISSNGNAAIIGKIQRVGAPTADNSSVGATSTTILDNSSISLYQTDSNQSDTAYFPMITGNNRLINTGYLNMPSFGYMRPVGSPTIGDIVIQNSGDGTVLTRWKFRAPSGDFFNPAGIYATGFFTTSDIRLKNLIEPTHKKPTGLKAISFVWKDKEKDQTPQIGYSAQEVQKYIPNAVSEDADGNLTVNYIQVLIAKIENLENQINELNDLKSKLN